ncbi:hypothetical protein [Microbacterium sulfonylureivorans]|uniref:hypothetical protein n=1 Tax=Microbacterium sulfonylureivorans TaxID=2486854 RepID=UPI0013E0CE9A|nr:hypothetical protein [Microbacterium sulfonylureivorans]
MPLAQIILGRAVRIDAERRRAAGVVSDLVRVRRTPAAAAHPGDARPVLRPGRA